MPQATREQRQEKWKEIMVSLLKSWQFYILLAVLLAMGWLTIRLLQLALFEASTAALFFGLGLIVLVLAGYALYYRKGWVWKGLASILCLLLIAGCWFGQSAAGVLAASLHDLAKPAVNLSRNAGLYTYSQTPIRSLDALSGQTIGILENRSQNLSEAVINDLDAQGISVRTRGFSSLQAMMKALRGQAIRAVVLAPSDLEMIEEFSGFEKTRQEIVQVTTVSVDLGVQTQPSDLDLDQDPYTVLISGSNDPITQPSYRSSLNVLLTINPKNKTMLLTFVPRSLWVSYACEEGLACPAGSQDRTGFASFYTIEALRDTLSQNLGVTIDFTVRVDLNTLLQLADLNGSIKVQNDQEFTNGYFSFAQGEIEMDSPRIRQYIGSLNDFSSTDENQEKNQLNVLLALLRQTRLKGMNSLRETLNIIDQSVRTSFTYSQMCQLVRQLFLSSQNWNELYYAITGTGGLEFSQSLTEYAYVLMPDPASMQKAADAVRAVLEGNQPDVTPVSQPADQVQDPSAASPDGTPADSPDNAAGPVPDASSDQNGQQSADVQTPENDAAGNPAYDPAADSTYDSSYDSTYDPDYDPGFSQ